SSDLLERREQGSAPGAGERREALSAEAPQLDGPIAGHGEDALARVIEGGPAELTGAVNAAEQRARRGVANLTVCALRVIGDRVVDDHELRPVGAERRL